MKNLLVTAVILSFMQSCMTGKETVVSEPFSEEVSVLYDSTLAPFYHGVASGDPTNDAVVIWTRVTPKSPGKLKVTWEVAEDAGFGSIVKSDTASALAARDYTVKVDVTGLKPGSTYYYRFLSMDKTSPIGRTRTTPQGTTDTLRFAVVSCSNWEFGYFNAYAALADKDVDAVIHLGDYIYEYAPGGYGDKTLDRKHLPAREIVSLQDYRTRYSQYHLDEGLRAARQQHPFITIWDDHEVANNAYSSGAQNHQPDKEGDYSARKKAARQAYYEWLPIRESEELYRAISFGNLVDLIMLDERLAGRTRQADSLKDPAYADAAQSMLGSEQLTWLKDQLSGSDASWRVIGNQVIFSDVDQSLAFPKSPRNLDSWDGYPLEKRAISAFINDRKIGNVIILAGDTHASWAFEVMEKSIGKKSIGVEFGTTSISSSNWNEYVPDDSVMYGESLLMKANPHLKYTNQRDHGYLLLTITQNDATAEWYYVNTLREKNKAETIGKKLSTAAGTNRLK